MRNLLFRGKLFDSFKFKNEVFAAGLVLAAQKTASGKSYLSALPPSSVLHTHFGRNALSCVLGNLVLFLLYSLSARAGHNY